MILLWESRIRIVGSGSVSVGWRIQRPLLPWMRPLFFFLNEIYCAEGLCPYGAHDVHTGCSGKGGVEGDNKNRVYVHATRATECTAPPRGTAGVRP